MINVSKIPLLTPEGRRWLLGGSAVALSGMFLLGALMHSCAGGFEPKEIPAESVAIAQVPATQPAPAVQTVEVPVIVQQLDPQRPEVEVLTNGTVRTKGNVNVTIHEKGQRAETRPSMERLDTAGATGAGFSATGDKVDLKQDGKPSQVSIGSTGDNGVSGGASSGQAGGSTVSAKVMGVDQGALSLYVIGALALLGGGVAWGMFGLRGLGIGLGVTGIVLILLGATCAQYPWVPPVALGVSVLAGVIYVLWASGALSKTTTALTAVTKGVEDRYEANRVEGQLTKDAIAKASGAKLPVVQKTVRAVKDRIAKAKAKATAAGL
jgi:hypothetical protein